MAEHKALVTVLEAVQKRKSILREKAEVAIARVSATAATSCHKLFQSGNLIEALPAILYVARAIANTKYVPAAYKELTVVRVLQDLFVHHGVGLTEEFMSRLAEVVKSILDQISAGPKPSHWEVKGRAEMGLDSNSEPKPKLVAKCATAVQAVRQVVTSSYSGVVRGKTAAELLESAIGALVSTVRMISNNADVPRDSKVSASIEAAEGMFEEALLLGKGLLGSTDVGAEVRRMLVASVGVIYDHINVRSYKLWKLRG